MAALNPEQAEAVAMVVKFADQILDQGAVDEAQSNYKTSISWLQDWFDDLLSEDETVANAAATVVLPSVDLPTFATAPYRGLSRTARYQGDLKLALEAGQLALRVFARLDPHSTEAAHWLDEVGEVATDVGDHDFARSCFDLSEVIHQLITAETSN